MLVIKKTCYFIIFFIFCNSVNASDNLNKLFDELYYAKNLTQAEKIEDKIWKNWTKHPKSEYLTSKLENGTYSMYHQQYRMALKLFTDVINEDPKWAEGWNKRATLLFIMGNYEKSLDDIDFTIFSKLFEKLVGAPLKMNEKRFKEVCSPEYFIKVRNLPGGPSKQSITNSLEIYKKDLSEYKNIIVKCENSIDESKNKLINFYKNHS